MKIKKINNNKRNKLLDNYDIEEKEEDEINESEMIKERVINIIKIR